MITNILFTTLLAPFLILAAQDLKSMTSADMKALALNTVTVLMECKELQGVTEIQTGPLSNKTDESIDKEQLWKELKSELDKKKIKLNIVAETAPNAVTAGGSISSTKTQSGKSFTAVYTLTLDVKTAKATCKREGVLRKKI